MWLIYWIMIGEYLKYIGEGEHQTQSLLKWLVR